MDLGKARPRFAADAISSAAGTLAAGFTAQTRINRKDWGLNWNKALETGGWLVGDEIKIDIEIEFTKVPEQQATPERVAPVSNVSVPA